MAQPLGSGKERESLFAQRLQEQRLAKGWSYEALSRKTTLSKEHIGRIERDENLPSLDLFEEICIALDVRPDYLLGWSNKPR